MHLYKPPGVAESIDWAAALAALGRPQLDERTVDLTLGTVLKYQEDQARVRAAGVGELVRARRPAGRLRRLGRRLRATSAGPDTGRGPHGRRLRPAAARRRPVDVPTRDRRPLFAEALGAARASTDRAPVYWAGRATLVRRPEDIPVYDRVFAAFWQDRRPRRCACRRSRTTLTLAVDDERGGADADDGDDDGAEPATSITVRYSRGRGAARTRTSPPTPPRSWPRPSG